MEGITSTKNPQVAAIKALKTRKAREEAGAFLVEGAKMVKEAIALDRQVLSLWTTEEAFLPEAVDCPCYVVPEHVMQALCNTVTPQGIAAVVKLPVTPSPDALGKRIIVLEDVQDPGNVGTILRTADAAGFTGAILSKGTADPFSPKCLRATMGSIFRLPLLISADITQPLTTLKSQDFSLLAAELSRDDFFERQDIGERVALIIGNEGNGISRDVSMTATHHLALPMAGGAESLNAAIAAGIMMYDLSFRNSK